MESFAAPGGVLLSDSAYAQIQNRSDVAVVPLGQFRFKNVGRPFELYAVSADGQRFLINTASDAALPITLVLNWRAALSKRPQ